MEIFTQDIQWCCRCLYINLHASVNQGYQVRLYMQCVNSSGSWALVWQITVNSPVMYWHVTVYSCTTCNAHNIPTCPSCKWEGRPGRRLCIGSEVGMGWWRISKLRLRTQSLFICINHCIRICISSTQMHILKGYINKDMGTVWDLGTCTCTYTYIVFTAHQTTPDVGINVRLSLLSK